MERAVFGLFGTGGFSREVMPFAKEYLYHFETEADICFVETTPGSKFANGIKVISEAEFYALNYHKKYFNIAIASSKVRERIANDCIAHGALPLTIKAQGTIIYEENEIGDGAILCVNSIITSNAKIGRFFHSNLNSYVAHDCIIGDFVTFAPDVHCNGNVHICDHAYIGTGGIIKQGTKDKPLIIGEGAIVGMGAVVTKSVPAYTTVVGNPARPFEKGVLG